MEKAGFKTFVYSFVFSLFAVFGVNGVYLCANSSRNSEIRIPSKNITLFLKDTLKTAENVQAVPAKKIVLSVLPEITPQTNTATDKIPLMVDDFLEEKPLTKALASNQIPLQSSGKFSDNLFESQKEKVISNFDKIIKSPPPIDENELTPQNLEEEIIPLNEPKELQDKKPLYAPEVVLKVATQENLMPEDLIPGKNDAFGKEAQEGFVEQKKLSTPQTASTNKPQLLIPLEKDQGRIVVAKNEVKIAADIKDNQVALNAQNIPIKSMVRAEASPSSGDDKDSAKWQSMEEKYVDRKNDTPWVVAKGGKFPRNEMVLEDAAYKQDEEEIRKILSSNTSNGSNTPNGTIKLASETVKNLLIPIPEDILKEKNLTPQLVSSNKNKKVENEMAAKEALREEERIAEEKETTTYDMDGSEQSATPEKSGGIINSITSIFSSKNKNTPQIGDSVGSDNQEQNSLLSAFTRKKNNSFSKILPTEIRLSFQPNRAEISGQTLKWIRAFAQKTTEEPSTGLEIRIDGSSSPLLQRRRLNLLQNILMNEGADHNKINTVFTVREPNSFILRTVKIDNERLDTPQNRNPRADSRYMQW